MSTNADAWQAGIDAVIADNSLNRGGFADAIRTVATLSNNGETTDWIDAIATAWEGIGIINNPTYSSLRNEIINEGALIARGQFDALQTLVNGLPASGPINIGLRKILLRDERDQVDTNITTLQGFKAGQNNQVRDAISIGIDRLREYKQAVKDELQGLNGG